VVWVPAVHRRQTSNGPPLVGSQRYQEAADLLETIYQSDQTTSRFRICFAPATIKANNIRKPNCCAEDARKPAEQFRIARLSRRDTHEDGATSEALAEYDRAAATFQGSAPIEVTGFLRNLVRSMVVNDLDSVALARIDQARVRLGDPTLLAAERGGIFEKRQDYREAVREYLPPLLRDTTRKPVRLSGDWWPCSTSRVRRRSSRKCSATRPTALRASE